MSTEVNEPRNTMQYVGIDAGRKHWVCILDEKQKEVVPRFCIQNTRADYDRLEKLLGKQDKLCIEDTGSYSRPIFQYLKSRGYDIILIKGLRSKRLREFLRDSWKTDLMDCHVLALVRALEHTLPTTDLETHQTQDALKPLVRLYCDHANRRGKLRQRLYSIIQHSYPELSDQFAEPTCQTVLGILRFAPRETWNDTNHVCAILKEHELQCSRKDIERALACFRNTVGTSSPADTSVSFFIDSYWSEIRLLEQLEVQLARMLLRSPYATLVSLPYIGLITTAILVSEAGDIRRFANPKKFVKYCGFRFSKEQSGDMNLQKLHSVSTPVRWVLSSVVLNLMKYDTTLKAFAERLRARGKKPLIIRFAVARKLLVRLYFEMKKRQHMTPEDNVRALQEGKLPGPMRQALKEMGAFSRNRKRLTTSPSAGPPQTFGACSSVPSSVDCGSGASGSS